MARLSSAVIAAVFFAPSFAAAATLDFNVPAGDWNVATNWIDHSTNLPPAAPPGAADDAHVRNNGTMTLSNSQSANGLFIGFARFVESDPINNPGVFDLDVGQDGAMNWTGGTLGTNNFRIGKEHNGTVTQSGGDITLNAAGTFRLGDGGSTSPGLGTYTMTGGSITFVNGTSGNNGIDVINGTFNLKGGTITQSPGGSRQRSFRVAARDNGTATLNISGGTINADGGFRIANNAGSTGIVNVNQADGTTTIFLGGDLAIGRNSSTTAEGRMYMSAGSITIGTTVANARLQVGDSGRGIMEMSGGSIDIFNGLRLANNPAAQGSSLLLTGGTITTRGFDSRTAGASPLIPETGSTFTVDGGTYNQLAGTMDIGQRGKVTVEIKSGSATVPAIELAATADSKATLSLSGGTLTVQGAVNRTVVAGNDVFGNPATAPVVSLTGGTLVLNPSVATLTWQTDLDLLGADFNSKPGARLATTVGVAGAPGVGKPGDFSLNAGSIWHLDIVSNDTNNGADFVNVVNGAADLNGGALFINTAYTPSLGDTVRIARSASGAVSYGSVYRSDRHWRPSIVDTTAGAREIRLTYVPEPTSVFLAGLGLAVAAGIPRRCRTRLSGK